MRFSATAIIAFVSMSNALPAPQYGSDQEGSDSYASPTTTIGCDCDSPPIVSTTAVQGSQPGYQTAPAPGITQIPDSSIRPSIPAAPAPSTGAGYGGSANLGAGLDLGGLIGGLLGGGKLPGLDAGGSLNLEGILGGLTGLLGGTGQLDGSGHLAIGGLLDGLKGKLEDLPGGAELGSFCDELKIAMSGSGYVDLNKLIIGLEGLLSGSGKIDLGASLGVDISRLMSGLKLLLNASVSGPGGLDIVALCGQIKHFLVAYGHLDLSAGAGIELGGLIDQLGGLLSASGAINLDVSGVLDALHGLLSGSLDLNGFIAACAKLPGGELLVSLCGKITGLLGELGINLSAMFGQFVAVLHGVVNGGLQVGGSILSKGTLDLGILLNVLGQVKGDVKGGLSVGGQVGAGGQIGGNGKIGGAFSLGGWLNGMFGGKNY